MVYSLERPVKKNDMPTLESRSLEFHLKKDYSLSMINSILLEADYVFSRALDTTSSLLAEIMGAKN